MPYGQTYEDLASSNSSNPSSSSLSQTPAGNNTANYAASLSSSNTSRQSLPSSESYSTITITADCQPTLTLTSLPSYYITAAPTSACTGTSASCPCAADFQCQELSPCLWGCEAYATPTARISSSGQNSPLPTQSTRFITNTQIVVPVRPSQPASPAKGSSKHPPYAGSNVAQYLPCVPGTFICLDSTTWDTCTQNAGGQWTYNYPRQVAAGMQCITFLSPSGSSSQQGQQGSTPQGYYRNDRVVRARPDGDCSQNGAIKCTQGGQMFEVCDQGGWVDMGQVAAGTRCENGQIV